MIKAVFFDAGHTLLYAHPDLGSIYTETTRTFGVEVTSESFAEILIPVFKQASRDYAATSAASDEQDLAMWRVITKRVYERMPALGRIAFDAWFEALYSRFGDHKSWRFYDDVTPVLTSLRKRGLKVGVVSNWDTRLRRISEGVGLTPLVDFLVISAEAGIRKPNPGIFEIALKHAGVKPEEALHIGDNPEEDGEGARRAGVKALIIDRRQRVTLRPDPGALPVLRSLEELYPLL